ncbi:MAG: hypothetical protein K8L99_17140 [Anaerolineae bacterium]|nr:hypothetical protein [Anaerolineae bacterium]
MLSRFTLIFAVVICIVILASLLLILGQAAPAIEWDALVGETCELPCWQGITPGQTTTFEALNILQAHPWIANVSTAPGLRENPNREDSEGSITWDWSGQQPRSMLVGGTINVRRNLVQSIQLVTMIPFGEIWLALGWPDRGSVQPSRAYSEEIDVHLAIYTDKGLTLRSIIPRPRQPWTFWHARVEMLFQARQASEAPYYLPCWFCS